MYERENSGYRIRSFLATFAGTHESIIPISKLEENWIHHLRGDELGAKRLQTSPRLHRDGHRRSLQTHKGHPTSVPTNPVAVAVALADKLDTLVGFWAIDEKPTGSKDPYALRRAALGVVRIILENGVRDEC